VSFVYLDTSVALAHLLAEDRAPSPELWTKFLISSRLIEYEIWNRIHSRKLERTHGDATRALIDRLALVEMIAPVLARATEPFPTPVRTLDALHLSAIVFLAESSGQDIELASYDTSMARAARALGIRLFDL
jgi:predicted nucleic acid-binding protein